MVLVLTGVVALVTLGLWLLSRRLELADDEHVGTVVVALSVGSMLWTPEPFRSIVVIGLAVMLGASIGGLGIVALGGLALLTAVYLPGGASVLVLGIVVGVGISETLASRRHLVRISRAQTLVANEPVPHEVELTGTVRAVRPVRDPLRDEPCALWQVQLGTERRASDELLELRGDSGSAIIDPRTIPLEWKSSPATYPEGSEAETIARRLGLELAGRPLVLRVLREGQACYVIGRPVWEIAPAECTGLYRDQPVLPTFRTTEPHPVWFCDRSEAQLRKSYTWVLASWLAWGAVCAAIAIVQLGGWTH